MTKSMRILFALLFVALIGATPSVAADDVTPKAGPELLAPSPAVVEKRQVTRADAPVPQMNPLFMPAHKAVLEKKKQGVIDVYFLGDSITRRWQATDYPQHKTN